VNANTIFYISEYSFRSGAKVLVKVVGKATAELRKLHNEGLKSSLNLSDALVMVIR
jgi:hypothetical protein